MHMMLLCSFLLTGLVSHVSPSGILHGLPFLVYINKGVPNAYVCERGDGHEASLGAAPTFRSYAMLFLHTNTGPITVDIQGRGAQPLLEIVDGQLTPIDPGTTVPLAVFQVFDGQEGLVICPLEEGELFSRSPECHHEPVL